MLSITEFGIIIITMIVMVICYLFVKFFYYIKKLLDLLKQKSLKELNGEFDKDFYEEEIKQLKKTIENLEQQICDMAQSWQENIEEVQKIVPEQVIFEDAKNNNFNEKDSLISKNKVISILKRK